MSRRFADFPVLRLAASGPGLNLRCWLWTLKSLKEKHRATEKHCKWHEHGPFRYYYIDTVYGIHLHYVQPYIILLQYVYLQKNMHRHTGSLVFKQQGSEVAQKFFGCRVHHPVKKSVRLGIAWDVRPGAAIPLTYTLHVHLSLFLLASLTTSLSCHQNICQPYSCFGLVRYSKEKNVWIRFLTPCLW